jgi:DNA ligase-1
MKTDPWKLIQLLERDNSRLYKEDMLSQYIDDEGLVKGLLYCLDNMITFGVADIPYSDTQGEGITADEFYHLADQLKNRELTGNAARDAILSLSLQSTIDQWNDWYRRILIKDLRCGVSLKTVNNVKKGTIPVFTCMLAHSGDNNPKKITGDCVVEYKYDGVRAIIIVENSNATIYSRNGKQLKNFPHIEEAFSNKMFDDLVFDGEVMSADFQTLMKQVHRKEGAETTDAYFALFDFIPLDEFKTAKSSLPLIKRKELLKGFERSEYFKDCIVLTDYTVLNIEDDADKFKAINNTAIEEGYEGIMVKPVNGYYECKRSYGWLKMKPYIEVTLTVIDIEEGTGKNEGSTGALVCEGTDEGKLIKVNVGTGLSDANRDDIWNNRDAVLGQLVEVRADVVTISQDSEEVYSLRFPRFKCFRGFEPGEKL